MSKAEIPTKTRPTPFGIEGKRMWILSRQRNYGNRQKEVKSRQNQFLEENVSFHYPEVKMLHHPCVLSETQIECDV